MTVTKVGPNSKERRPGESAAQYLARVLTPREQREVLTGLEAVAAKRKYGPKGIGSVAIKHILDKREARYNREAALTRKRRRARKREGRDPMGRRITSAQKRRNSMKRDANGMATYPDDGE